MIKEAKQMTQEKKHSERKVITQDQAYALLEACKYALRSFRNPQSISYEEHLAQIIPCALEQAIKSAEEG